MVLAGRQPAGRKTKPAIAAAMSRADRAKFGMSLLMCSCMWRISVSSLLRSFEDSAMDPIVP